MSLRGSIPSLMNPYQRFEATVADGSSRMTWGQCGSLLLHSVSRYLRAWDLHPYSLPVSRRTQSGIRVLPASIVVVPEEDPPATIAALKGKAKSTRMTH